jgi:hypothetical protein
VCVSAVVETQKVACYFGASFGCVSLCKLKGLLHAMRRAVFMLGSRQSVRAAKDKISCWSKGVSGTLNSGLKEQERLG